MRIKTKSENVVVSFHTNGQRREVTVAVGVMQNNRVAVGTAVKLPSDPDCVDVGLRVAFERLLDVLIGKSSNDNKEEENKEIRQLRKAAWDKFENRFGNNGENK